MVECDCIYAKIDENKKDQIWCEKKNIYTSPEAKETCEFYQKK